MSLRQWPDGVFPSVALSAGRGWLAVREGDPRAPGYLVVYVWAGTDLARAVETERIALPGGSPCFPNLFALDGLIWLAYHDGSRLHLRNLSGGQIYDFAGLSNPTAFGGRWFAYCEPQAPYAVHRLDLVSGEVSQPRLGAPTGLSRILDDGRVVTVDEDRFAMAGSTIPSFAGPLVVAEGHAGGVDWDWDPTTAGAIGTLWHPLDSFTPKCAIDGERLAVTAAGSGSVRLFCGTLGELLDASTKPVQPPAPPVQPPPLPIPGPILPNPGMPPAETAMPLPSLVLAILRRFVAVFPVPQMGRPGPSDDAFENRCRAWVWALAEQVRAETNDPSWGTKNGGGGRPQSKDAIALQSGPVLWGFDLLTGVGTGAPTLVEQPQGANITGQTFMPVKPNNHLTGTPAPPTPQSAPPSGPDPALLARIAMLEEENRRLEADNRRLLMHPSYAEMKAMIAATDAAFQDAQPVRTDRRGRPLPKAPLSAETAAHFVWRLLMEGFSFDQLVADARQRGGG